MRISDWSSDVCSSDLCNFDQYDGGSEQNHERQCGRDHDERAARGAECQIHQGKADIGRIGIGRSEEHTSELQSLMRISYAVFCLKKKIRKTTTKTNIANRRNYIKQEYESPDK